MANIAARIAKPQQKLWSFTVIVATLTALRKVRLIH